MRFKNPRVAEAFEPIKLAFFKLAIFVIVRRWLILSYLLLLLIVAVGFSYRKEFIANTMPYPLHADEAFITQSALQMLVTGDPNPHFFNYPSLPIYLTKACMEWGAKLAKRRSELAYVGQIESVTYPYYRPPTPLWPARIAFALLSVFTLFFVGLIDRCNTGAKSSLWVSPLLLSFSGQFLFHSWRYLNVDIVGSFFVSLGLWHLLATLYDQSLRHRAVIPGILCGLAMACKYPLALLALPYLLAILLFQTKQSLVYGFCLFGTLILTFAILVPYSIIDAPGFWHGVRYEIVHYRSGHPGFEGQAGILQFLFYIQKLFEEYGAVAFIYACVGMVVLAWLNWRKAVIFLSMPLALLLLMSMQKVHFIRNVLILLAIWPVLVSLGMHRMRYAVLWLINKINSTLSLNPNRNRNLNPNPNPNLNLNRNLSFFFNQGKRAAALAVVSLPLVITLPWRSIAQAYDVPVDSRKVATKWIKDHVSKDSDLIIAKELQMDTQDLRREHFVHQVAFEDTVAVDSVIAFVAPRGAMIFLVPEFGPNPRRSGEEVYAQKLNGRYAGLDLLQEFGREPVRVKNVNPAGNGNPKFSIRTKGVPRGEPVPERKR